MVAAAAERVLSLVTSIAISFVFGNAGGKRASENLAQIKKAASAQDRDGFLHLFQSWLKPALN
jgi:hypothetical protein